MEHATHVRSPIRFLLIYHAAPVGLSGCVRCSIADELAQPVPWLILPADFFGIGYSNLRNSSTVSPASCTIPPSVKALIGLCRGIVT
jgi:hypothetical protein